jgi:hypothetical protein
MKLACLTLSTSLFLSSFLVGHSANALSITNGSFETGTNPGSFTTLGTNDTTTIPGWNGTNVDYIGTVFVSSNGSRSVELSGTAAGRISTLINIADADVGTPTNILFDLATNRGSVKLLTVSLTGFATQNYAATGTVNGIPSSVSDWITNTYSFTPTAAGNLTLLFTSLENSGFGPALDNVRLQAVQAVPFEFSPAAGLAMLGLGLGISKFMKKS